MVRRSLKRFNGAAYIINFEVSLSLSLLELQKFVFLAFSVVV